MKAFLLPTPSRIVLAVSALVVSGLFGSYVAPRHHHLWIAVAGLGLYGIATLVWIAIGHYRQKRSSSTG